MVVECQQLTTLQGERYGRGIHLGESCVFVGMRTVPGTVPRSDFFVVLGGRCLGPGGGRGTDGTGHQVRS
jgi:hypothetical protein